MIRPKHTRKDRNHSDIVTAAREFGIVVWDTADIGGRVLDTLMCWRGRCIPVEIKARGHLNDLTEGEREGIAELAAVGVRAIVATQIEDIVSEWLEWEAKRD